MTKKILAIIAAITLLSSMFAVGFAHSAFAQDFGFGATTKQIPGTSNKGVTGAQPSGSAKSDASIKVAPSSGPPGSEFTVYGIGFKPSATVKVTDPFTHKDDKVIVDSSGAFADTISVPADETPGLVLVDTDGPGWSNSLGAWHSAFPSAYFKVTEKISSTSTPKPKPPVNAPKTPDTTPSNTATGGKGSSLSLILKPTSGPAGTEVEISGGGAHGTISILMGGAKMEESPENSFTTTDFGGISGFLTIPESAQPGPFPIKVTDSSGAGAEAIFTVTGNAKTTTPTKPAATLTGPTSQPSKPTTIPGTTKTTGKTALPTGPSKHTITLPTTPAKPSGTIAPKTPTVHSCPTGSVAVSGKCVSKGQVVAALQ